MVTGESGNKTRRKLREVPRWAWPLWTLGVVICFSIVHMLLFTSDPRTSVTVVNDTSVRLHFFDCQNDNCTQRLNGIGRTLGPGEAATDVWNESDGTGQIGEMTVPGNRLIGCLPAPRPGRSAPVGHTAFATLCRGQKPGSAPVVVAVNP